MLLKTSPKLIQSILACTASSKVGTVVRQKNIKQNKTTDAVCLDLHIITE